MVEKELLPRKSTDVERMLDRGGEITNPSGPSGRGGGAFPARKRTKNDC